MAKTVCRIIRDLGDGLVLRRAAPEDAEALAQFNGRTHGSPEQPSQFIIGSTRDLMTGKHPTFKPRDFTIVEDTRTGQIVSSLNLFSQRWSYGGVEFPIGRPELVGTDRAYRRRGLIRAQFEVVHGWSAQRGHVLQAVTGIPNFYRQFGYEMALELEADRRGHRSRVPKLAEGAEEPYRVRPAVPADVPFMGRVYAQGMTRSLVSSVISPALWRYYLGDRSKEEQCCVIETPHGVRAGLLVHGNELRWGNMLSVTVYELKPGTNWLAVTPAVLRYLAATGAEYAARDKAEFEWISFKLGTHHVAYEAMPDFLKWGNDPYAFYLRVPDLPGFVRLLAPVLEERLAKSVAVGWSGDLKLSFFRDGLRLGFRKGKLVTSEPWSPSEGGESACFRGGTFLHLLFGQHTMEDLRQTSPECYPCSNEARVLLRVLFPKQPSSVWAVT